MDFSRIQNVIDTEKLNNSRVAIFGTGGSAGLACNLARCGVKRFLLVDWDDVSAANVSRQQHDAIDIGRPKVEALADAIRRINPDAEVEVSYADWLPPEDDGTDDYVELCEEICAQLSETDLLIFATDSFAAQAAGNVHALTHNIPALWIGLYPGGLGGEIIFWHSGIDACFRCLCASRYEAHQEKKDPEEVLTPPSDGCTIFDVAFVDAIAGNLAIGLLTQGGDNRFGRLIDELGDRNFIQVQLDPAWEINGKSPVRKHLGVKDDCPAFFAWNTIVREDPFRGGLHCPDCERYRGHIFGGSMHGIPVRFRPELLGCASTQEKSQ